MLKPLIQRARRSPQPRAKERGVTLALVALALVSIIAMAALSIDIGTFYEARAEAQRSADAAALTAARVISISGITGNQNGASDGSWADVCGGAGSPASLAAIKMAQQNLIAGVSVPSASVTVEYGASTGGASTADCSGLTASFSVNPIVKVTVQRTNLPIFFGHVFSLVGSTLSSTSVSATATAEVFNSSDSGTVSSSGDVIPVHPRCVKPWIIPNADPDNGGNHFVHLRSGQIFNQGVYQLGSGVIGESFTMVADCKAGAADCEVATGNLTPDNPPQANTGAKTLDYIPALVSGTPSAAPSCSAGNLSSDAEFQPAIGGCDQTTVYTCGVINTTPGVMKADLTENPVTPSIPAGDTSTATQCLIHQSSGSDTLNTGSPGNPVFPFQIQAGSGNPLVAAGAVFDDDVISSSDSIVTIPIANFTAGLVGSQPAVTIVGFMQVFINRVDGVGNLNVTVLNVSGCGDGQTTPVDSVHAVFGTSAVPIRLISPP